MSDKSTKVVLELEAGDHVMGNPGPALPCQHLSQFLYLSFPPSVDH